MFATYRRICSEAVLLNIVHRTQLIRAQREQEPIDLTFCSEKGVKVHAPNREGTEAVLFYHSPERPAGVSVANQSRIQRVEPENMSYLQATAFSNS